MEINSFISDIQSHRRDRFIVSAPHIDRRDRFIVSAPASSAVSRER